MGQAQTNEIRPIAAFIRASTVGGLLVLIMTAPTLTRLTSVGRLDTNDGRFSIWNVAWIDHALLTDPANLLDANIFWPHRGTLAYSELNLVAGVFGLPFYAATGSPLAALNGAAAIALWLSFVSMWALVRRLTGSDGAGLVSAVGFTFSPYVHARTPHIQLLMVFVFPLVLLAYHRLAERPTLRRGGALGGALAVAALACGYYGIFAACTLAAIALLLADASRRYVTALGAALVTCGAVIAPVYVAFSRARAQSGAVLADRSVQSADWSANVSAYLASGTAAHAWWTPALATWQPWNDVLFPGIGILLLAVLALARVHRHPSRRTVLAYAALATLACWASFGPGAGLYRVLELTVPGMSLLRAPSRFGIVVTFGLAVIAGYAAASLISRRPWLAWLLVIALACELAVKTPEWGWPSWPLRTVPALSEAYQRLRTLPRAPLVEFPFPYVSSNFHNHGWAMFWSTYHWQPMVNGYSDLIPPEWARIALPINGFPDPASFEIMRERRVRYVLWHLNTYSPASRAVLDERLARYAEYLTPIVQTGDDWLFEIARYPGG